MFKSTKNLGFLALTVSAAPRWSCPSDYSPMETFDLERYAGLWYSISRDWYTPFGIRSECVTATYTPRDDGLFTVRNDSYDWIYGYNFTPGLGIESDIGDASVIIKLREGIPEASETPTLTVLDTDYETYAVVYICQSYSWFAFDLLWVLSREP